MESIDLQSWRDVSGYQGLYQVNGLGQVRSLEREVRYKNGRTHIHKASPLKPLKQHNGYFRVCLQKSGEPKYYFVHRLIAREFLGDLPLGYQVNHKDGNKGNNNILNLEYVTPSQNKFHAYSTGLQKPRRGSKHHNAKLTAEQAIEIKSLLGKISQKEIAAMFKISPSSVGDIKHGRTWWWA